MTVRDSETILRSQEDEARERDLAIANVLRLLSSGASGSILMALGPGPLRTKELTERVPGYAPRTIYRYASKLAQLGIVERQEEPGVPSKVVHSLTEPCGRELYELVDRYADASLGRLPSGEIGAHEWGSLALLADLWESRMVCELNIGPRSATELARGEHDLTFHQVSRRASLFAIGGLIVETMDGARRRRYALTDRTRRAMALIAGLGRWRRRHVMFEGKPGLSAFEAAGLMRTVLPLVGLPDYAGESFELRISPSGGDEAEEETVWVEVEADGSVVPRLTPVSDVAASARGNITAWIDVVLEGPGDQFSAKGDARLLDECLRRLHAALWDQDGQAGRPEAVSTAAAPARLPRR